MNIAGVQGRGAKRDATRRRVQAHALRLMSERGYDGVSIDEIAEASGISRRTFFNYFAGKEAAVFDPDPSEPELWSALLAARPVGEALWDSLRELLIGYTTVAAEQLVVQRRVSGSPNALHEWSRGIADRFWEVVHDWAQARTSGDDLDDPQLRIEFSIEAARTVLTTACARWDVELGIVALHELIDQGFQLLGRGLGGVSTVRSESSRRASG